jgi:hypothetical protein
MRIAYGRTWSMVRKLKNVENVKNVENETQILEYDKKILEYDKNH